MMIKMITKEDIQTALKTVDDPELGIDIYTLGLIYDVRVSEAGDVYIKMTHTTPLCPYGNEITKKVKEAIYEHIHPKSLKIEITFDPPWQPTPQLRNMLGV
ncbi:MAG: putative metal-sulfur cluster biosynthetic enzyme [Parcubacteria group bacterium Gr01-1014_70]|nr:MAG: putative metal-sulfur cluster biosynthetic enzyme [Parcubacteria group bacterium Gr01-1014_70]